MNGDMAVACVVTGLFPLSTQEHLREFVFANFRREEHEEAQ